MSEELKTHVHVIKRNGEEVTFDLSKIENAIKAANNEVDKLHQLNEYQVHAIADNLEKQIESMSHAVHVEDIQDMVLTLSDMSLPSIIRPPPFSKAQCAISLR